MSKGVKEVLTNIGWLGADRVVRMGGALLVGTMVARYLGPDQFGIFNYAFAIYGIFNIISSLGLDFLVVREVALNADGEQEILGTSFLLKVLASFLTTLLAVVCTWLLRPNDRMTICIVALLSVASIAQGFDVIDYFLQAKTRSRYAVLPKTIVFVLASLTRLIAMWMKYSLIAFAWIAALEILLSEAGLVVGYIRYHKAIRWWRFDRLRAVSLLGESFPLILAGLLIMIYMRTDQILLGSLATTRVVGQYSAAVRLSEIWYAIPTIICASVMPRVLQYRLVDPQRYLAQVQRLYDLMALVSIGLALFTMLTSRVVISLLYGPEYHPAAAILCVHIWTGVFVFSGVVSAQQLIHQKNTGIQLQRCALGACANLALNYLLIPRYGGIGSAVATLISQALAAYVLDLLDSRTRMMFKMKSRAFLGLWLLSKKPFSTIFGTT